MGRTRARGYLFFSLIILVVGLPQPSQALPSDEYDVVVDVTGLPGDKACQSMQAVLNDALTGRRAGDKRILIKGSLGTPENPANFSMFQNKGASGTRKKAWPYSVCHAFWPIVNAKTGEGVVDGYPDPFFPTVLRRGKARAHPDKKLVVFAEELCHNFVFNRKRAFIQSGTGAGQMRRITGCQSRQIGTLEREWDTPPDSTSVIQVLDWRNPRADEVDLHVHYELDVHYENSAAQEAGEYGVFADVGLHCYFMGALEGGDPQKSCLSLISDGIHRSGSITIREYGQRDDGEECRPTWPARRRLMNRDYSIIWQALGPGVLRGSDDTELHILGEGDRDNVGVLLFQTWTKDFKRWRIGGIGTGLWIAGSLNNALYDPYIALNDFGVVVGSNERWGSGWPRWDQCFTGNCEPNKSHRTGLSFRGGVVEGNPCGNFVMFGGYSGEVDRTFVETGPRGAKGYAGHSVLVGAGVCDYNRGPSRRQGTNRSRKVCGDDEDCGGVCVVDSSASRNFEFVWDAVMASNRADPRWFAFMLGKGTQAKYNYPPLQGSNIRVTGKGFGGEFGHGMPDLDFYPSAGAALGVDASAALAKSGSTVLPAYDYYVGMPHRDLHATIRKPKAGVYGLGTLMAAATCTRAVVVMPGKTRALGRWTLRYGRSRSKEGTELFVGGRALPRGEGRREVTAGEFDNPYLSRDSEVWLVVSDLVGTPSELSVTLRCWEDG
jgi:hypothetical protein